MEVTLTPAEMRKLVAFLSRWEIGEGVYCVFVSNDKDATAPKLMVSHSDNKGNGDTLVAIPKQE